VSISSFVVVDSEAGVMPSEGRTVLEGPFERARSRFARYFEAETSARSSRRGCEQEKRVRAQAEQNQ
jgi:hypothetical protein